MKSHELAKKWETPPTAIVQQNLKLKNYDMYAQDMVQTHAGSIVAALVFANSGEFRLVGTDWWLCSCVLYSWVCKEHKNSSTWY